mgnify:FL=1
MKSKTKKKIWMPRRFWTLNPSIKIKASAKVYGKKDRRLNKVTVKQED